MTCASSSTTRAGASGRVTITRSLTDYDVGLVLELISVGVGDAVIAENSASRNHASLTSAVGGEGAVDGEGDC